jgi:hypothetical protein
MEILVPAGLMNRLLKKRDSSLLEDNNNYPESNYAVA